MEIRREINKWSGIGLVILGLAGSLEGGIKSYHFYDRFSQSREEYFQGNGNDGKRLVYEDDYNRCFDLQKRYVSSVMDLFAGSLLLYNNRKRKVDG